MPAGVYNFVLINKIKKHVRLTDTLLLSVLWRLTPTARFPEATTIKRLDALLRKQSVSCTFATGLDFKPHLPRPVGRRLLIAYFFGLETTPDIPISTSFLAEGGERSISLSSPLTVLDRSNHDFLLGHGREVGVFQTGQSAPS